MSEGAQQDPIDSGGNTGAPASSRWLVHLVLWLAAALQLARIFQVQSNTGEMPFLSANDRSRWCTIAALAVNGSYEIDDVLEIRDPKTRRRTWYSIDLVRHRGADGRQHYYSSKPPMLPTMYAGVYLAVRAVTGATLMNDPFLVVRIMLLLVNWLPLLGFWWLLLRWLEREVSDGWGQVVMALFITWGTYLSTFVITLNNHLPAAIAVGGSLWCVDRIALKHDLRLRWFVLAGLCTSFGAANELPALSWLGAVGVLLGSLDLRKTLLGYVLALVPVAVAFFSLNYQAHGEWAPAYAHRDVGEPLSELQFSSANSIDALDVATVVQELNADNIPCSTKCVIRPARRPDTWELWDADNERRYALKPLSDPSGEATGSEANDVLKVGVYAWGDWYDYPGSYWTSDRKQGVDRGEPSRGLYIFHSLLGHHGIVSLTPFWLLSIAGCVILIRQRTTWNPFHDPQLLLVAAIMATTIVVLGFYFARGLEDRNYGGVTSGFRWSFWLIPLWLWTAMMAVRTLRQPWMRRTVEGLLVLSVFSASFPWRNPWTSPWLMQLGEYLGWV